MTLRKYIWIVQHRWWMFALGMGVAGFVAFALSKAQRPIYRAESTLLLNLAQQPATPTYSDVSASQALTKTYAQIITAQPTIEEAAKRLGGGLTYASLKGVTGSDVPQTELLHVAFESKDPQFAAQVVNAVSEVFKERVRESQLDDSGGGGAGSTPNNLNTIYVIAPASVPRAPVSPRVSLNTALGALLGLVISIGVVALLEYLDDTVKAHTDLESLGLSMMGIVRRYPTGKDEPVTVLNPSADYADLTDAFRQLRTNIEFAALDGKVRSLAVTSTQPGEGKSTTAANLAIMMARSGRKVILVDTDLRRPSLHRIFKLSNRVGVTTAVMWNGDDFDRAALKATPVANLSLLTSGPLPPNPTELLGSKRMASLIRHLEAAADVVVFDTPPATSVADSPIVASQVDATLLVIETGRTRVNALRAAVDQLSRSRTRLLGGVLNKMSERGKGYGYYYTYYAHRYTQYADASTKVSVVPDDAIVPR